MSNWSEERWALEVELARLDGSRTGSLISYHEGYNAGLRTGSEHGPNPEDSVLIQQLHGRIRRLVRANQHIRQEYGPKPASLPEQLFPPGRLRNCSNPLFTGA